MSKSVASSFISVRFAKSKKLALLIFVMIAFLIYYSNIYIHRYSSDDKTQYTITSSPSLYNNNHLSTSSPIQEQEQEEKYLAYLPHSGLSNQRIELSNALLLSYMLNRTLLIPPAFLGIVFGWMPREQLVDRLDWLTSPKNFNKLCQRSTPGRLASYVHRSRCDEYHRIGMISWSDLHDFQPLQEAGIKIKFQNIVSMKQLQKDLQLKEDDIYLHQDVQLYDWRLYENKTEAIDLLSNRLNYFDSFSGRRYYKVLLPRHFERRREKVLYLGGIFGSTRFSLIDRDHKRMQQKISQVLHYRLDTALGQTVESIVNYLGGKGTFMSVHFRTGDRPFKKEIGINLENFKKNMTDMVGFDNSGEGCKNIFYTDKPTLMNSKFQNVDEDEVALLATLGRQAKIYIATDHRDPRGDKSELLPWFDAFPCTTTLGDLPEHLLAPLEKLKDLENSSKSLRKYLIPIVDAMVAAHARRILTTPRSTFSKYIEELHTAWIINRK